MISETVVKKMDRRWLGLESLTAWYQTGEGLGKGKGVTLLFDMVMERFSWAALNSWCSQGMTVLMGPGFGPIARYQAQISDCLLICSLAGAMIPDGQSLWVDRQACRWSSGQNLGGSLSFFDEGSVQMSAFLAAARENPCVQKCVADVVAFNLDPQNKRI